MKTFRNHKIQFYTTVQKREELSRAAASLHRSIGFLFEDAIAKLDEHVAIPESYFSLNGGRWRIQQVVNVSKNANEKLSSLSLAMPSLVGRKGAKSAIMRFLTEEILSKVESGEYAPKIIEPSAVQIVVPCSMHKVLKELFPRKYNSRSDEWGGGIARHVRKVIQTFKVEDFPEERVRSLYEEFTAETGGLHPYTTQNKQLLLAKGLRCYSVEMLPAEQATLDAIGKGKYGAKAAICYYAYKLLYEKVTQKKTDVEGIKRVAKEKEIPHACGMELPLEFPSENPQNPSKELKKDLKNTQKDVAILKTDVGMLKNTQKQLIYTVKRLNERVFSKKKPIWWFHVLVIWTIATVLITLGLSSLLG